MPDLFIITGSNGAGKSTAGKNYLPPHLQDKYPIFDGDKLFMQKQRELWQQGMRAHKEAKKIAFQFVSDTFDRLVEEALTTHDSFVYEGHFTNDATWDVPRRFREQGYTTTLVFFGLTDPDLSEIRVIDRAEHGGHYVPRLTIEDNFFGNLEKLDHYYTLFHRLFLFDTSGATHELLAAFVDGQVLANTPALLPGWFTKKLPALTQKIQSIVSSINEKDFFDRDK